MEFESMTLSQKIAQSIADQIAKGTMKPGERLLEMELTEKYGTSKAPIREALYILENDGIVNRIPRRGVFVKKYTKRELLELYEALFRLQEIALQKIVDQASNKQVEEIATTVETMAKFVENKKIRDFLTYLNGLQNLFFKLADNSVIEEFFIKINKQLIPFRYMSLPYNNLEQAISEYCEIVEGLKERDVERIMEVLSKKEKRTISLLEKTLENTDLQRRVR